MFHNGRKTCCLSHVRLGDSVSDFELLDISLGIQEEKYDTLLKEMNLMHFEFLLGFNAVPEVICTCSFIKS